MHFNNNYTQIKVHILHNGLQESKRCEKNVQFIICTWTQITPAYTVLGFEQNESYKYYNIKNVCNLFAITYGIASIINFEPDEKKSQQLRNFERICFGRFAFRSNRRRRWPEIRVSSYYCV